MRRMKGEGSLRKRPDGRWEIRVMLGRDENGKRKGISFYGKTKKEVQANFEEYKKNTRDGIRAMSTQTFTEWSDFWLEHHRENISPTTYEGYRYTLRRLQSHFGPQKILDIKPYDVEVFLREVKREGRPDSFISQCRGMLFQIFHKAEANDLIRKNPVRFAEKMRSTDTPHRKDAFTAQEVQLLMENLPTDIYGLGIRLMLGTGLRTQELLALEPRHIEPDGSVIHVRQAVNLVKGTVHVGVPKSRDSYRDVPVPVNLRWCAVKLRATNKKFIWEMRVKEQPCNPSHFRNKFKAAVSGVEGVRELTPHSCRHTYVSQLQALGVDLATIQSIVGHASEDMTKHYLHVQDSIKEEAVQRFAAAFHVDETHWTE